MTHPPLPPPPLRWRLSLLLTGLLAIGLLGLYWWPSRSQAAPALFAPDPVTAAWEKAKAAGSYHFTSDVLQKSIPVATITNVGRTSRTDALHLEGQNDLHNQKLELTLWNQGGSVLNAASGVSIRTEGGKSFTRRGNEAWQETDNQIDAFAPQGDFLGYLAAIRQVSAGVQETRNGISFTRYTFELDGPAFANYMHEQLIMAMRAKGELPPGVQLDPPAYYRDMTGSGELWVGANGLPVRQILNLRFPEQNDERVEAAITVNFSTYGAEQHDLWTLLRTGQWQGAWLVLPGRLPDLTGLWLGLAFSAAAFLLVRYRRLRAVQTAIVTAVIVSQIVGPVLSAMTQTRFFDNYRAKAAAQEEKQAADQSQRDLQTKLITAPAFNPHQNPVEDSGQKTEDSGQMLEMSAASSVTNLRSPVSSLQAAAAVTDPGIDTDKDGLTDFTEVRIGTSEVFSDTDDDGLLDNLEVNGFTMGGQTWYTDPNVHDSNNDGLADIVEWGIDRSTGLPQATPLDTDSDSLPDLFDLDNDNDGVPDRVDAAPLTQGAATYSEANPLQLTINNLTPGQPTFVEFQIRPQDPKNLWFAYNTLDWPQDTESQIRDVDGKTYADIAPTQGRTPDAGDANGDMKLLPMLEIRIPITSANLPSQAELTPFNISVNDFTADGKTKIAYVPLALVTDELTGERVAFSGQMRYKPTGSWTVPHSVRLAWVVQALNDLPCDPEATDAAAQGCQSDGHIHNVPLVLHSYYDNWTLTGLGVREENGASMGIVYEDPAVDPDKKDEAPLWGLTDALSEHFLKPHDVNNDGVRDLKLSDFSARFDRNSSTTTDALRFGLPNILKVVTNDYVTSDEAAMTTAMTKTVAILDTAFKSVVQADNGIKPLLLFAEEHSLRAVGLDLLIGSEGYVTQNGANVSFNLAPTAATALPVTVQANLKWQAYCGADGNNINWRPCTSDEYAGVMEDRYANAPSLPDDTDPAEVPGRMMVALAYYSTLAGGYSARVQEGTAISAIRYTLENESDTIARLRIAFNSVTVLPQIVQQTMIHVYVANVQGGGSPSDSLTRQVKTTIKAVGGGYYALKKKEAQAYEKVAAREEGRPAVKLTEAQIKATKLPFFAKLPLRFSHYAVAAPIGSALMLLFNVLSQVPEIPTPTHAVLGTIGGLITLAVAVYLPAATAADIYQSFSQKLEVGSTGGKPSMGKILTASYMKRSTVRVAFAIGLVINVALIWGFYAYVAGTSGLAAGSPELNKAAAEAIAATVIAVVLAVISLTLIGTIIVSILTVIDLFLNLACDLGAKDLRMQGSFYGGACFSIVTTATKVLAYLIYNYEPMVDTSKDNLMTAGVPVVSLADPSKGFVASNSLTITLPVTTTAIHKSPDPSAGLMINFYLWLFSQDNLKSSTFKYGLAQSGPAPQAVDLGQMTDAWQNVTEDHKYVLTPMYSAVARTDPAPLGGLPLTQGLNSPVPFDLTMSFAIPAYECFPVIVPVCRTRELENTTTMHLNVLSYDVFPKTLAEFIALGPKADGGVGQRWDARFPSLHDADGDGLNARVFNGLDPDDTTWDADADGLSDRFELNLRAEGVAYSPLLRDTDNDGLTDRQEAEISTNPLVADTDNDGLSDGAEIRHQVVGSDGKLTTTWAGGWQVTINSTPARTIWVSSDPFFADGDQDGVSDQAEKELAANPNPALRLDDKGVPYHPAISNLPPLAVLTESDALFGYIAPGQSLQYTSTVVASVPMVPGVLNVSVPAVLGSSPNPARLGFSPSASTSQTLTVVSNFTTAANAVSQAITLTSTANTRLPYSDADLFAWTPATTEASFSSGGRNSIFINGAAAQPDRQDSYRLLGQSVVISPVFSLGTVTAFDLPAGTARNLVVDPLNPAKLIDSAPAIACNDLGVCLAVWSEDPDNTTGLPIRIAAARFAPDGTISQTFAVSALPAAYDRDSAPVVASDGSKFLIAWQRTDGYSRALTANTATIAFQTELMTRLYDGAGNALTPETLLTGDRLEFWSANINTTSALNVVSSKLNRLDLDWVGDRYRLTRGINLGNAANDPTLLFEDNGAPGNTRQITWRDINAAGVLIAGSKATVYNQASNDVKASHSLVYNPSTNEVLLVQTSNFAVLAQLFSSPAVTTASTTLVAGSAANAVATYYAPQRGYLIGWTDTSNNPDSSSTVGPFHYQVRNSFFQLVGGDQQKLTWPGAVNATAGMALACPAAQSAPTVDLRFEEPPDTTGFLNSADFSPLFCSSATSCPAAGFPGAPNASGSDYAVQFDGADDKLVLNTSTPSSFSVALWMKTTPRNVGTLAEQGAFQPSGWTLTMINGQPALLLGTGVFNFVVGNKNVDDDAWHFVVATRNGITGALALYVDGALVGNSTESNPGLLDAANQIIIGSSFRGQMDHFQLYRTALSASTVQALYNRTAQSYCVAAAVAANGNGFPWSRFSLAEQDTRGGRITASGSLRLQVDPTKPTASITSVSNNAVIGPDQVIGGSASDVGVGVGLVEVSVNNGPWQVATGANTWSFSLAGVSGAASLRVRATDFVGNVGDPSAPINVTIDNTPPVVTITPPTGTLKPTKNANGQWQVPLSGTASDANGVKAGSILVDLTQTSGVGLAQTTQVASGGWNINYLLDPNLFDPTGSYTVTVQADDTVGNRTVAPPVVIRLDATGPVAVVSATDLARQTITQTVTIGGVISDTNSIVGLDKAEIAFTPIEQIAALPGNITSEQAEAQLNRQWLPVTLAQRGAGVARTTWSVAIPAGLENIYQIDVRSYDLLGNVSISAGLWRGMIDTRDPRLVMTATATGATYVNTADNTQRYAVQFICAAQDRNLNESSFVCPGEGLAEPVRSFENNPALQALFPDLTLRTGLALSYTLWTTSTTPAATVRACDTFGRCAQASTGTAVGAAAGAVDSAPVNSETVQGASLQAAAAAPGAPLAVIVNPTAGSFVAAGNAMSVTVAAEAGAGVKDVTIKLDNVTVQTLSFAQSPVITRTVRTINVPVATEGAHTLVAQATNWANATQTTLFPIRFTLDRNAPSLTIDPAALTLADTWQPQSGVLRFDGTASDSVGLAAVQIREGNNGFSDATFGGGTWRVALPVTDPEGRTLNITVRAIDRAGRITQVNQAIGTQLSAADAPDTRIVSGPANPSATNSASFVFTSTVSAFECSLDNGAYTPCASPASYSGLSKGSHTFLVRAIDGRGLPDLTPATFTWNVNAGQPDVTITGKPTNPTTDRTASFTFVGGTGAASFECSLDGSGYTSCTSPKVYTNLGNGDHTFLVRARSSANVIGAADRYTWTINNLAPVANNQSVVVVPNQNKAIVLTATDNEPLLYTIVTPPKNGVLSGIAPNLVYAPNTNYGGVDSFTFKVSDGVAESNIATVTLFVDNVPPTVTCSAAPNRLWPPNHTLSNIVTTVTVSDSQSGPAGFVLVSVMSSEADKGLNKDDIPNDIQGWTLNTADTAGQVRAERSDTGRGRTYTLTYRGRDVAGNTTLCRTLVFVPLSTSQPQPTAVSAAEAESTLVSETTQAPAVENSPVITDSVELSSRLFLPLVAQGEDGQALDATPVSPGAAAADTAPAVTVDPAPVAPQAGVETQPYSIFLPLLNQ